MEAVFKIEKITQALSLVKVIVFVPFLQLYEKILQADSTQAEAYWGQSRCTYGRWG